MQLDRLDAFRNGPPAHGKGPPRHRNRPWRLLCRPLGQLARPIVLGRACLTHGRGEIDKTSWLLGLVGSRPMGGGRCGLSTRAGARRGRGEVVGAGECREAVQLRAARPPGTVVVGGGGGGDGAHSKKEQAKPWRGTGPLSSNVTHRRRMGWGGSSGGRGGPIPVPSGPPFLPLCDRGTDAACARHGWRRIGSPGGSGPSQRRAKRWWGSAEGEEGGRGDGNWPKGAGGKNSERPRADDVGRGPHVCHFRRDGGPARRSGEAGNRRAA